jgi:hypothetical protein
MAATERAPKRRQPSHLAPNVLLGSILIALTTVIAVAMFQLASQLLHV